MDVVAQILLTSIFWGPALVILYWVIRLAVRHALEDADNRVQLDRRRAAAREVAARQEAANGVTEPH